MPLPISTSQGYIQNLLSGVSYGICSRLSQVFPSVTEYLRVVTIVMSSKEDIKVESVTVKMRCRRTDEDRNSHTMYSTNDVWQNEVSSAFNLVAEPCRSFWCQIRKCPLQAGQLTDCRNNHCSPKAWRFVTSNKRRMTICQRLCILHKSNTEAKRGALLREYFYAQPQRPRSKSLS
jgi:hypothetical protein